MSMLTLASFEERDKAELLRDRLEQAGIHATVYDESNVQKYRFLSTPHAAMKLCVDDSEFDHAKRLVEGLDEIEGALRDAVRCPQCKSSRVEYPQFTRKFTTTTLVELACSLKLLDKAYYCTDCHYTWPKEEKKEPERDLLGWPVKK